MKITKEKLKQIIKEEMEGVVQKEPLLENENPFHVLYDEVLAAQKTLIKVRNLAMKLDDQIGAVPNRKGMPQSAASYISAAYHDLNHLFKFLMEKST